MNILKIWDADYPWDIRVEKICRALASNGHDVHLLCRNLKKLPSFEKWEYGYIHRLPCFSNKKVNYATSFPLFFNPFWLFWTLRVVKKNSIDIIIVRDLPLALCGVIVGRIMKRPVILDMAENYSFMVDEIWRYEPFNPFNFIVRNRFIVRLIEKIALKAVDNILVVVEESMDRLLSMGVEKNRVAIVSNTPDLEAFKRKSVELEEHDRQLLKDRYVIIYVGGLEIGRGLEQVIDALPAVVKKVPDILFLIFGRGNAEKVLTEKIKQYGLSKHVILKGWINFEQVPSFISASNVGIIPHYVSDHTNHTISNKLFDYMSKGLPVIASSAKPMVRIIEEEKCGLIYSDTRGLSDALIQLSNLKIQRNMGRMGKAAVLRRYNWAYDTKILKMVINKVSRRRIK
jgi:glycosyltransferase involved in cell wall biosynthesis